MPVSGLPVNLDVLLGTVTERFSVKSWQVYEEKGGISFKIKFDSSDNSDLPHNQKNASYIRKPTAKCERDRKRSKEFNANNQRVTRSKTLLTEEREMPRNDSTSGSLLHGHIDTPVKVCDLVTGTPSTGGINNTPVPVYDCSTPLTPAVNNDHSSVGYSAKSSTSVSESSQSDHSEISETETDKEDPVDITTTECHFSKEAGHDPSWRGARKTCLADGCGIYVCHGCFLSARHSEHQEFIKFRRKRKLRARGQKHK